MTDNDRLSELENDARDLLQRIIFCEFVLDGKSPGERQPTPEMVQLLADIEAFYTRIDGAAGSAQLKSLAMLLGRTSSLKHRIAKDLP